MIRALFYRLRSPIPGQLPGRLPGPKAMPMNSTPDVQINRASSRLGARGFTLIEIMVVVVIIGLLAAVIVPTVVSKIDEARVVKAKQDIQALEAALLEFRLDNSKYPTTEQGLAALVTAPTDPSIKHWRPGGYIQRISKDPWANDYHYENPGTHGKDFDLYTLGADDQPGGEGQNADIGNWNMSD